MLGLEVGVQQHGSQLFRNVVAFVVPEDAVEVGDLCLREQMRELVV
jgi:hypothetical protein